MTKLIRYFRQIFRLSFLTWMQYPQDIFAAGIGSIGYTVMQLVYFHFLFTTGRNSLGGYSFQEFYLVFFITQWSVALFFLFSWRNIQESGKEIERGNIDIQFIRPISPTLLLHFPRLEVNSFVPLLFIQSVLAILFFFVGLPALSPWFLPFALFCILAGWFLLHCTLVMSVSMLFYLKGFWGMYKMSSNFSDFMQYPKNLFPTIVQLFFSLIIPYFWVADPIYSFYKGTLGIRYFLVYILFYGIFITVAYTLWDKGLKKYEGG